MSERSFDPALIVAGAGTSFSLLAQLTNAIMVELASDAKLNSATRGILGNAVAHIMKCRTTEVEGANP